MPVLLCFPDLHTPPCQFLGTPLPPPLEVMAQALYLVSLDLVQTRVPSSTSVSCGSPWDSISCVLSALKIGFPVDTD